MKRAVGFLLATHQKLALGFVLGQLEGTFVGSRSVSASTETAQEVRLDRRKVLVAVEVATEFELLDLCDRECGTRGLRDGDSSVQGDDR